jgi:hypothetical protein
VPITDSRRPIRAGAALFALLVLIYNANLKQTPSGDTITTIWTARTLAESGSIRLDRYAPEFLRTPMAYAISDPRGTWVSNYPILPALLAVPAMAALRVAGLLNDRAALYAGKFTASLLVAGSAALLYFAMRRRTTAARAWLFALLYGVATSSWSMSSQSLWQHAASQLFLAGIVWLLVAREGDARALPWLGLACGLLVCGRPADVVLAALVAAHAGIVFRRESWRFFPPAIACAIGLLVFNITVFGSPLGGYAKLNGPDAIGYFHHRGLAFAHNLAAILISPNRGLFVFSPVLLYAACGMGRFVRNGTDRPRRPETLLIAASVVFTFQTASYGWWDGGHCYGPRLLSDILPAVCFFLAWLPEDLFRRPGRAAAFAVLAALSVAVHAVGAFGYPGGGWNSAPVNIIEDRSRVWDWRDPQILREWRGIPDRH